MSALPLFDTPRPVAAPSGPRSLLKLTLRDYQQQAVDGAFSAYARGEKGALIRQPTGTGKTIVGSACIDRWLSQGPEYKALVIAHERQLIWQFAEEIHDVLGITPAIEMASQRVSAKRIPPITVASRATLAERVVGDEVGSRLYKFRNQFHWLVIWDEAHKHHPALPSCRHIIDWFDGNPENRHLGLTATPERTDKKSLKSFLPAIAIDFRMITYDGTPSAITEGWCVPYDQRFITVESIDFTKLSTVKGDFDENELEAKLADAKEMAKYVRPMLDLVGNRSTIIFNPTRLMADKIARYINAVKGRQVAYSLDGTVPEDQRKDTYSRFNRGAFQFLSVCGLCREGFNSRICSAVAIFRPTKSRSLAEQMKGRGCRPLPGVVDGVDTAAERRAAILASAKPDCIAEGSLVLTDHGLVPIESVTREMKVWDGVEYVSHGGAVCRGEQDVITYAGLTATPDHRVWTRYGFLDFQACASQQIAICVTELGGTPVREADGCYRRDHSAEWTRTDTCGMPMRHTLSKRLLCRNEIRGWMQDLWPAAECAAMAHAESQSSQGAMRKPTQSQLPSIWRQGNQVRVFSSNRDGNLGYGEPWPSPGSRTGSHRQRRELRTRKLAIRLKAPKPGQHQESQVVCRNERLPLSSSERPICGRHPTSASPQRSVLVRYRHSLACPVPQAKRRVWDILNAGPRHRFTVSGVLVSNCMIIDLVGVSGIADCASTAHIYAEGLDDRVVELANRSALKKGKAGHRVDMAEEVRKAKEQYDKEQAKREERKRQREENKKKADEWRKKKAETDRLAQEEMDRLAALGAEVTYHQRKVRPGMGGRVVRQQEQKAYIPFGKYRGQSIESVPSGYLHWFLQQNIKPELRHSITAHLDKLKKEKRAAAAPQPQQVVIPTGINYMDLVNSFLKRG